VTHTQINAFLKEQARAAAQVPDARLLNSIAGSLPLRPKPVRPLLSDALLASGVFLACALVAIGGGWRAGFNGFQKMDWLMRGSIFIMETLLLWFAGTEFLRSMIPGSRRRLSSTGVLGLCCILLLAVFGLLFREPRSADFLHSGIACLTTGFLHAVPAALLSWIVLRRGFAVSPLASGMLAGTAAGLAGVGVLEFHCTNFEAAHVLLWHVAVVPLTAATGAAVAVLSRALSRLRA